ncbi:MAG: DUF433 domain-containing protein [Rickettsiales bacterium]
MNFRDIITIDSNIRSGKPCLSGTRIAVSDVLEYMASGMTAQQICNDFPEITAEHIQSCLAFAANREQLIHQANFK